MKTKILFLAANPIGTGHLALDEELRGIKEKLREAPTNNDIELVDVLAARPNDWLDALNAQRFSMVHFSGHGTRGGALQHVGRDGVAQPVSIQALKETLRILKGDICLVVLNACYSRQQAELIAEDIDCVIAMNESIYDKAAITFIKAFYRALFTGKSVQNAFEQGRAALMLNGLKDAHVPELLVRPGVDASTITLIAPPRRNKVFIACSGDDERFLEALHTHLESYKQRGIRIDYWDRTKLTPGGIRQQEMLQALTSARVAILLISASLFASQDFTRYQLSPLLQAAARNEIKIFCVLLSSYTLTGTNLEQFTPVNSRPLNQLDRGKREEIWDQLTRLVQDTLQANRED